MFRLCSQCFCDTIIMAVRGGWVFVRESRSSPDTHPSAASYFLIPNVSVKKSKFLSHCRIISKPRLQQHAQAVSASKLEDKKMRTVCMCPAKLKLDLC